MTVVVVSVAENGRMVLPAEVRRAIGLDGAGQLRIEVTEDGAHITTRRQALLRARAGIQSLVPASRSLSEELIADRRREVEHDAASPDEAKGGG
jgi:AbrB family looped-hinge helix DNA binding protein